MVREYIRYPGIRCAGSALSTMPAGGNPHVFGLPPIQSWNCGRNAHFELNAQLPARSRAKKTPSLPTQPCPALGRLLGQQLGREHLAVNHRDALIGNDEASDRSAIECEEGEPRALTNEI